MINFLIVTHGEFGAYLVEAAESIVGRQEEGVQTVVLSARVSTIDLRERIRRALERLQNQDGLIVFTDMFGGTPSNLSFPLMQDRPKTEIVSGVNLYMLVSAFTHRADCSLPELVSKLIADGQKSICDIRRRVLARV